MLTSVFIIAVSVILFVYWLRYSCVLLLRNAQERSQSASQPDERFGIDAVVKRLRTENDLSSLEQALDRDYHVVTFLIQHAADLELASIENKLLVVDYKLMRAWSRITRTLAPEQSRKALSEMANVLQVLVSQIGDQNHLQAEA
jgi:hypothetical protein